LPAHRRGTRWPKDFGRLGRPDPAIRRSGDPIERARRNWQVATSRVAPEWDEAVKQYNKLVRDRVPAILLAGGRKSVTRTVHGAELLKALRAKIDEEVAEYDAAVDDAQAAAELADLLEVIVAMAKQRGYSETQIQQLRSSKAAQRGAFDLGFFLISAE
jgi:predicted house-cleaning noncanonical NTP pyrophosphatase (MazG superfamily)